MSILHLTNGHAEAARESVDLVQMALAEMWPINDKQKVVDEQVEIATNIMVSPTIRTLAVKNLVTMGVCNLKVIDQVRQMQGDKSATPVRLTDDERRQAVRGLLSCESVVADDRQVLEFS